MEGDNGRVFPQPGCQQENCAGRGDVDIEGAVAVLKIVEVIAARIGAGARACHQHAAQPIDRLLGIMPEVFYSDWAAHLEYHVSLPPPGTHASKGNYVLKSR